MKVIGFQRIPLLSPTYGTASDMRSFQPVADSPLEGKWPRTRICTTNQSSSARSASLAIATTQKTHEALSSDSADGTSYVDHFGIR